MKQIYEYFLQLDESQFIFCSDDMPVTRPIDVELIDYTEELLKTNKIIGRVGLTSDNVRRPHTEVSRISDEVSLIDNNNDAMYKLSGTWSAWNREYFLLYFPYLQFLHFLQEQLWPLSLNLKAYHHLRFQ